jgi:hypothetical protein
MTSTTDGATLDAPDTPAVHDGRILHALSRWLLWPVAATVLLVIGVSFLLSFQSQMELAIAARIRPDVAWGWPIIVDGTIVIATFAALILQPRGKRVSWYPWANLILFGVLSIYANGIHATDTQPAVWELFIIGAVPAVGLLVSTHMLVIMLGHGEHPEAKPRAAKARRSASLRLPPADQFADPLFTYSREPVASPVRTKGPDDTNHAAAYSRGVPAPVTPAMEQPVHRTPPTKLSRDPKPSAAKPMSREQVVERIANRLHTNTETTGEEVGEWMGLSPVRGARILEQIHAEMDEKGSAA